MTSWKNSYVCIRKRIIILYVHTQTTGLYVWYVPPHAKLRERHQGCRLIQALVSAVSLSDGTRWGPCHRFRRWAACFTNASDKGLLDNPWNSMEAKELFWYRSPPTKSKLRRNGIGSSQHVAFPTQSIWGSGHCLAKLKNKYFTSSRTLGVCKTAFYLVDQGDPHAQFQIPWFAKPRKYLPHQFFPSNAIFHSRLRGGIEALFIWP